VDRFLAILESRAVSAAIPLVSWPPRDDVVCFLLSHHGSEEFCSVITRRVTSGRRTHIDDFDTRRRERHPTNSASKTLVKCLESCRSIVHTAQLFPPRRSTRFFARRSIRQRDGGRRNLKFARLGSDNLTNFSTREIPPLSSVPCSKNFFHRVKKEIRFCFTIVSDT